MEERRWGVRLADVRLPRTWPVPVLISALLGLVMERRQLRELERIGAELGDYVGTHNREADERTVQLLALTRTLARLTWVLLVVTVATLAVTVFALVRG